MPLRMAGCCDLRDRSESGDTDWIESVIDEYEQLDCTGMVAIGAGDLCIVGPATSLFEFLTESCFSRSCITLDCRLVQGEY